MLSKMMPHTASDNYFVKVAAKKKQMMETQKSNEDSSKINETQGKQAKNSEPAAPVNSNWAKFRNIVSQQDSVQKLPKRQHSHSRTRWEKQKAGKIANSDIQNLNESNEQSSNTFKDPKQEKEHTKQIAIDCEMVGIGDGTESMIARVSLVNRYGFCIYDKYVKPREKVQDYRTHVSGIREHHLRDGEEFQIVQSEVSQIIKGKILVGHALRNDLHVLFLSHPKRNLRDTSRYKAFRKVTMGKTPSLKKLALELLGVNIQTGEHNSVEDARTAMQLYMLYKKQWELDIRSRS